MTTTTPGSRQLAVVGRSAAGQPRTFRLELAGRPAVGRDAAYRRLAVTILGLDVPTLARGLQTARVGRLQDAARVA
jgi:hypothetical protein